MLLNPARLAALVFAAALAAPPVPAADFYPLDRVKPGMKAVGRTVFSGDLVEEFQAEILGVLENVGPRQSIILARLSGGPLAKTGVLAGMSGSPVYIDGKLVGAVAFGFPFATEPITGIRPISEMIEPFAQRSDPPPPALRAALSVDRWLPPADFRLLPPPPEPAGQLHLIATPVHFGGFSARTLEVFGAQLRELGLAPLQGAGGAARAASSDLGDPARLQPGSMISVGLVRGDLNLTADGTLTHIDGRRLYAFGHRFLSAGPTDLPFMRASVIALLPSVNHSIKISAAAELMGSIRQDRNAGIFGEIGVRPRLLPVDLTVHSSRSGNHQYRLEMVNDRFLSPFLLQMIAFSAIDATERALGPATLQVRQRISFGAGRPAVDLDNIYAGESNIAVIAALGAALPMAFLMQSGFQELRPERVQLDILSLDERKLLRLERAWTSQREARPGERLELAAALRADDGREVIRKLPFEIPAGAAAGPLTITVADGPSLNLLDLQAPGSTREAATAAQLVRSINRARKNSSLYVRVWRPDRGFTLQSEPLPSLPASLKSVLSSGPSGSGLVGASWSSILAEMEMDGFDTAVSGSATLRLAVKE